MNPGIYIITRSRYRDQVQGLYDAGADIVVCEELEGGIEMGRYILSELGVPGEEISQLFREIRAFGSADFF
jgi:voltage-gated potassium channel Kch